MTLPAAYLPLGEGGCESVCFAFRTLSTRFASLCGGETRCRISVCHDRPQEHSSRLHDPRSAVADCGVGNGVNAVRKSLAFWSGVKENNAQIPAGRTVRDKVYSRKIKRR